MTRLAPASAVAFVALSVGVACVGRMGTPSDEGPAPRAETAVVVENRNFADMVIYLVRGGTSRNRLGICPGLSTRTFFLRPEWVGHGIMVQFQADPIGADQAPITEEMFVQPGDVIELIIPPHTE